MVGRRFEPAVGLKGGEDNARLFVWRMVYSDSDCDFRYRVRDRPFDETVRGFMKEPAPIGAGSFSFETGFRQKSCFLF